MLAYCTQNCSADFLNAARALPTPPRQLHRSAQRVMRYDPQIASRFERLELPVWHESDELCRFVAGYLALLPVRTATAAVDRRFVEYLVELTEGVTGRIVDVLRRAAMQAMNERARRVSLEELQYVGAKLPTTVGQRA